MFTPHLDLALLEEITGLGRPGLVLATFGGKGAERVSAGERQQLVVPAGRLLDSPQCHEIALTGKLSDAEVERARSHYSLEDAPEIRKGIGEFMVAGPELMRKLGTACHPGELAFPEGRAVSWAAIDWQRCGLVRPIPRPLLRELFPLYLEDVEANDQRFEIGLVGAARHLRLAPSGQRQSGRHFRAL